MNDRVKRNWRNVRAQTMYMLMRVARALEDAS